MEKALHFLATYNTQLIKGGFAVIFLLLIIYVYRMFFVVTPTSSADGSASSDALEQKLNQLIENQKNKTAGTPGENDEASKAEIDRLKLEVYGLKQQLSEAEKKVADAVVPAAAAPAVDAGAGDPVAMKQQAEKIKSLESRLAEYEIIAEDIAELTQLRTENVKLKEQLAAGNAAATPSAPGAPVAEVSAATELAAAPADEPSASESVVASAAAVSEVSTEPVVAAEKIPEVAATSNEEINQDALAQAAADEAIATLNGAKNAATPLTAQSAQDATDSLLASLAAEAADESAKTTAGAAAPAAVSEEDQKLLEEFEKMKKQ